MWNWHFTIFKAHGKVQPSVTSFTKEYDCIPNGISVLYPTTKELKLFSSQKYFQIHQLKVEYVSGYYL
jgi:hypothetical protein